MNTPPDFPGGGHWQQQPPPPPSRSPQLQGPRPTPLKVNKESHKIRKPPPHPPLRQPHPPPAGDYHQRQEPVIIYTVSPKVIHASVSDFMSVVQRLTGPSPVGSPSGALSPAARLASIEKTSPSERERPGGGDLLGMVEGVELGQFPGILSPAPATLPPIPAGFFSPVSDPQTLSMLHDLSPFWHSNSFMPSPSALLSAPLISPSPSSSDIFNNLFDF
ncbi:VQ motif containing protein [Trema orientale]|uniref:VQ motif containing protein n=1 Tax=Trema orientale TaxID=63057 RepID=A0A2P5E9J1_TREOI|nr:VQ motif containing protein [Trema orientale]